MKNQIKKNSRKFKSIATFWWNFKPWLLLQVKGQMKCKNIKAGLTFHQNPGKTRIKIAVRMKSECCSYFFFYLMQNKGLQKKIWKHSKENCWKKYKVIFLMKMWTCGSHSLTTASMIKSMPQRMQQKDMQKRICSTRKIVFN